MEETEFEFEIGDKHYYAKVSYNYITEDQGVGYTEFWGTGSVDICLVKVVTDNHIELFVYDNEEDENPLPTPVTPEIEATVLEQLDNHLNN